jgi:hypothetical protein
LAVHAYQEQYFEDAVECLVRGKYAIAINGEFPWK